jgi:hypothetical protein
MAKAHTMTWTQTSKNPQPVRSSLMQYQRHLSLLEDRLLHAAGRDRFHTLPDALISNFPKRDSSIPIWS